MPTTKRSTSKKSDAKRANRQSAQPAGVDAASPPRKGRSHRHRRPIVAGDLFCMTGVADPQITAAGDSLVFLRKVVGEKNRAETSLWTVATDGKSAARPLTTGTRDTNPRIAPDDGSVAFVRGGDKPSQVAMISRHGGEARVLTRFPEGTLRLLSWSPTGDRLVVAFRPTEEAYTEAAKKERERTGASEPPRIVENLWYRLDGDGWFGAERFAIYLVEANNGRHRMIYGDDAMGSADVAWSPDGTRLAITTNRAPDALLKPWKDELLVYDLASETLTAVPDLPIGPKAAVTWSPDGTRLAWAGRTGRDDLYSTENLELWTCAAPGAKRVPHGEVRSLTHAHDICLLAATLSDSSDPAYEPSLRWSRDSASLLVRVGRHGAGHLVSIGIDGSAPRFLTDDRADFLFGNCSSDGALIAATRCDAVTLPEAGVLRLTRKGAEWKALTSFNRALHEELDLSAPTEHWVVADDGAQTQVWVIEPPASAGAAKGRLPGILEVHGGPHTQYGYLFFTEFQLLAAQGYVVVYSNPRGSKGYGRDHCAAIRGRWGDRDWVDIQAVVRFMEKHPRIDAKRMGIMGGSYGGYMTNWAIGHTDRFKAAITDRCVSNLLSFGGNSDYPQLPDEYWPGVNFDRPERLWQSSPIAHLKGASTPTLIIHSEGDLRCNIEQSEQVHTALTLQGVPCRFVRYPESTSHGLSRSGPADLRAHRLGEILAWWQRWL